MLTLPPLQKRALLYDVPVIDGVTGPGTCAACAYRTLEPRFPDLPASDWNPSDVQTCNRYVDSVDGMPVMCLEARHWSGPRGPEGLGFAPLGGAAVAAFIRGGPVP